MTDTPELASPVLQCEVVSVDEATATAEVRFLNPAHDPDLVVTMTRSVPNPAYRPPAEAPVDIDGDDEQAETAEEEEPPIIEESCEVDPNPHVVKSVRIPLTSDGAIDQECWQTRLAEQARGVKARWDAATALAAAAPGVLAGLVGPVSNGQEG